MELKVWVEGIQRIVCGVTEATTCQDVVFALAHATGKVGRFTLIERWRSNERLLAPHEFPLKILMKWGEYSNDVQFILQRSDSINPKTTQQAGISTAISNSTSKQINSTRSASSQSGSSNDATFGLDRLKDIRKSLNHGGNNITNTQDSTVNVQNENVINMSSSVGLPNVLHSGNHPIGVVRGVPQSKTSPVQLIRKDVPPYRDPPPPYRSPPPPNASPANLKSMTNVSSPTRNLQLSPNGVNMTVQDGSPISTEAVAYNQQYRELVSLVNYQREKLSNQQADLTKYDAEIVFWEAKGREQQHQVEMIQQQINSSDAQLRISSEQVQSLAYIEDEAEIAKQAEKTLKSELTLVRSKLANCETELLQCKNKIRKLVDDIQFEQRVSNRSQDNRQQLERSLLIEVERLQSEIQQAKHATEMNHITADTLKREVGMLEAAILDKKRQVEQLVNEMKEANLQSLSGTTDEIRHLLEGSSKPGSTRRIIGSPRQLENAVPTNKNPHGVWV
ncbi:ras association domain-containing protein 8 isoform X2 [Arctopsyche grandis]|uniref:ras association domain-containing protein 8 isoform X2 n=1 Tax=Arctopsyche grandis TaxID=121162 RepID=UPI00406D6AA5